ncbi:MAG TPA: NlpC/P60 family protein [Acidimicrobiales bacterium]|nr:NlpC/P60 family protein [Acidimicrobiales bacterium]
MDGDASSMSRARRCARLVAAAMSVAGLVLVGTVVLSPTASAEIGPGVSDNFWLATPSGPVEAYGVPAYGGPTTLNQPVVGATTTNDRQGYWLVAGDGGIFSYGDAQFYGSTGNMVLNKPIVGLAPTPDDAGYWMVATDGGIFSYGDAQFYGSTGNIVLNKPVVAMASTPDGKGYWTVASDGGVFSFGDAQFYGSTGNITLNQPIVGMEPTPDGRGYWLVAADGGVFNFGDAGFYGSAAGSTGEPVEKLVSTPDGQGYWILEQNGTALAFGDAGQYQLPAQILLFQPITPGDKAVLFAFQQLGKPYIWGGNGPQGYDCSGLALASWENGAGIGFARVADDQYETAGSPVALDQLQAGDLVFWGDDTSDWTTVYHTAIYVGGDRIVEATGDEVQLNTLDQWGTDDLMPNGRRP